MRNMSIVALLVVAVAGSANAQASIDPGMTKEQVIAKLGKPASEHSSGTTTYLYYANGQEKTVGMSDMVAIENGKVVDAVFRSASRKYSGTSSSPKPISAEAAIVKGGGKVPAKPLNTPAATKKAPEAKKAAPPAKKLAEPAKKTDTKKIEAPVKKTADTAKKTAPAPAKKP
jgi:outer membrane protein assembly factor BamE (lipoprotein component of BamABCDE complex)